MSVNKKAQFFSENVLGRCRIRICVCVCVCVCVEGIMHEERIKGPWSPEEDVILSELVDKFGARNWSLIARGIPGRSGKSCRLRWCNQLNPGVNRKPFTGNSFLLVWEKQRKCNETFEEIK